MMMLLMMMMMMMMMMMTMVIGLHLASSLFCCAEHGMVCGLTTLCDALALQRWD